jgi:hypothetical protein
MADRNRRGLFLSVIAVLYAVLAVSNLTKFLQHLADPSTLGIVFFGYRATSALGNLFFGLIMATVLASYSYGVWKLKPWIVPLSIVYAFYVPTNLVLFWYLQTGPPLAPIGFIVAYLAVSLPGSIGTALYIAYQRDELL